MGRENRIKRDRKEREAKRENTRLEKPSKWLVVCEGTETEVHYFNGVVKYANSFLPEGKKLDVTVVGTGKNTVSLVLEAEDIINDVTNELGLDTVPYGLKFIVFDKDSFTPDQFNNAIQLCKNKDYIPCWSNECFETWLLMHFLDDLCSALSRVDCRTKLTKKLKELGAASKYEKNMPNIFDILLQYGSFAKARKWANRRENNFDSSATTFANRNPASNVRAFFDAIDKHFLEQEISKIEWE